MKKSFLYLSSIAFASLLIIDSADVFAKSKEPKEPKETIASSIFNGADIGAMINSLASEISTLKQYASAIGALGKKAIVFVSDSKSFSHNHQPALLIIGVAPFINMEIYAQALIKANTYIENGLNYIKKMKTKSSKQEAEGRKLIELGSSLSNVAYAALSNFRADVVIAHKGLRGKQGVDFTRSGDFEITLQNTLKLFGEKKKIFSKKLAPGELGAEDALDKESAEIADSLNASKLQPMFEQYSVNIDNWDKLIHLNEQYMTALIAFINGDSTLLDDLATQCNDEISGANERFTEKTTHNRNKSRLGNNSNDDDE